MKKIILLICISALILSSCVAETETENTETSATVGTILAPENQTETEAGTEIDNQIEFSKKDVEKIYEEIYFDYQIYYETVETGNSLELIQGSTPPVKAENEGYYFLSESETYKTVDDLIKLTQKVFTDRYIEEEMNLYFEGEKPYYTEIDGQLARMPIDAFRPIPDGVSEVINNSETSITFTTKIVEQQYTSSEMTYEITIIKENDKWKIDNIKDYVLTK